MKTVLLLFLCAACDRPAQATEPEHYQGTIELEERVLGFELPGRVARIDVDTGDALTDGQVIAQLDPTLEEIARDARRAELHSAEAQLALLEAGARREEVRAVSAQLRAAQSREDLERRNLDRTRGLATSGAVGTAVIDEGEGRVARAQAERETLEQQLRGLRGGARAEEIAIAQTRIEAASVGLRASEERLARYTLHADGAGVVLETHFEPGEIATAGAPIVTVADVAHPYVDVFVPQQRVAGIHIGAKALVTTDSTPDPIEGAVETIARRTEFTPRYLFSEQERPNLVVRVRIRIEDSQRLLHAGVPAFARIEEGS